MTDQLQKIHELLGGVEAQEFKRAGIFTNSLLNTTDTTQIIRDIRDEEVVFFQGKKMSEIDYEMINNFGMSGTDQYAQYEMTKLLEMEIESGDGESDYIDALISQLVRDSNEYYDDVKDVRRIYKRLQTIKRLWASSSKNMLDSETNMLLHDVEEKLEVIFEAFDEIGVLQQTLNEQRDQMNISLKED